MDNMVGVLAMATFGIVLIGGGFFYLRSLKDPRNMDAAKNAMAEDGSSAHTAVRGGRAPDHLK